MAVIRIVAVGAVHRNRWTTLTRPVAATVWRAAGRRRTLIGRRGKCCWSHVLHAGRRIASRVQLRPLLGLRVGLSLCLRLRRLSGDPLLLFEHRGEFRVIPRAPLSFESLRFVRFFFERIDQGRWIHFVFASEHQAVRCRHESLFFCFFGH